MKFTFALLKCLSTPAHMAVILQTVFLDTSWSLGDVKYCWWDKVGVSTVGVRRLNLRGLNMLFILLNFELARA